MLTNFFRNQKNSKELTIVLRHYAKVKTSDDPKHSIANQPGFGYLNMVARLSKTFEQNSLFNFDSD